MESRHDRTHFVFNYYYNLFDVHLLAITLNPPFCQKKTQLCCACTWAHWGCPVVSGQWVLWVLWVVEWSLSRSGLFLLTQQMFDWSAICYAKLSSSFSVVTGHSVPLERILSSGDTVAMEGCDWSLTMFRWVVWVNGRGPKISQQNIAL